VGEEHSSTIPMHAYETMEHHEENPNLKMSGPPFFLQRVYGIVPFKLLPDKSLQKVTCSFRHSAIIFSIVTYARKSIQIEAISSGSYWCSALTTTGKRDAPFMSNVNLRYY
jgi:hypothetical protein